MSDIIPFGKYKGQPVEVLAADRQYLSGSAGQSWFRERYQNIYAMFVNNFAEPTESRSKTRRRGHNDWLGGG